MISKYAVKISLTFIEYSLRNRDLKKNEHTNSFVHNFFKNSNFAKIL